MAALYDAVGGTKVPLEAEAAAHRWQMCGLAAERITAWMSQVGTRGGTWDSAVRLSGSPGCSAVLGIATPCIHPRSGCKRCCHYCCCCCLCTASPSAAGMTSMHAAWLYYLQIRQRLWVRNGQQLLRLEAFYNSPYW